MGGQTGSGLSATPRWRREQPRGPQHRIRQRCKSRVGRADNLTEPGGDLPYGQRGVGRGEPGLTPGEVIGGNGDQRCGDIDDRGPAVGLVSSRRHVGSRARTPVAW
jgi:hypothetical protein